jgi:hypothetical protein
MDGPFDSMRESERERKLRKSINEFGLLYHSSLFIDFRKKKFLSLSFHHTKWTLKVIIIFFTNHLVL